MSCFEEIKILALCYAADNRDAFSRLVEMHQQGLRRFLINLCNGDLMLADDIAQDTFLKAWMNIRSFRGLSGFRTWLYRIAVNEYLSYKRLRQTAILAEAGDTTELRSVTAADGVAAAEASMDVGALLTGLSETERTVVLLFYLEDLPIKEIVKITNISEGTVKSHLSRARHKMAKIK